MTTITTNFSFLNFIQLLMLNSCSLLRSNSNVQLTWLHCIRILRPARSSPYVSIHTKTLWSFFCWKSYSNQIRQFAALWQRPECPSPHPVVPLFLPPEQKGGMISPSDTPNSSLNLYFMNNPHHSYMYSILIIEVKMGADLTHIKVRNGRKQICEKIDNILGVDFWSK